jgi:radical SAM protein with 4Fe4S-binding SPASM domain
VTTVPFRGKTSAAALFAKIVRDPHRPISAMIEVADRCNEVCVHCYQVQGQKGELSTEEWKRILDELAEMGVLFVTISGGEATLRNDFIELVEHARARRFAVKIFTNGLTMTSALAQRLSDLAVQEVQISLYSHRAEVHDWVTRVPGSWQKAVDGARSLIELGVSVVLKSPMMSFNAGEIDEYVDFVTGLGAEYTLDPHVDPREDGDRSTESWRVDDASYVRARLHPKLGAASRLEKSDRLDKSVCGACSGNVHIEPNGEMRPCTQLNVPLGSALDGVRRGWEEGESARAIRTLTWADLHGCRDCDLRIYCSRCFANAHMERGDALGPYASACRKARLGYEAVHGVPPVILPSERGPELGPYRKLDGGVFVCADDVLTERDERTVREHAWVRSAPGAPLGAVPPSSPGQLVQIRRPGRRRPSAELVPSAKPEGIE